LVGYSIMVSVPVLSTAWVGMFGFSEVEVGRVAGADIGGSMALIALFLYIGIFVYMHQRQPELAYESG